MPLMLLKLLIESQPLAMCLCWMVVLFLGDPRSNLWCPYPLWKLSILPWTLLPKKDCGSVNWNLIGKPLMIHEDNQAAIKTASNPILSDRTKHIEIRYHWIREKVKAKLIELNTCSPSLSKRFCSNVSQGWLVLNQFIDFPFILFRSSNYEGVFRPIKLPKKKVTK